MSGLREISVEGLEGGAAIAEVNAALESASADVSARFGLEKARKVVLTILITPDAETNAVLIERRVEVKCPPNPGRKIVGLEEDGRILIRDTGGDARQMEIEDEPVNVTKIGNGD